MMTLKKALYLARTRKSRPLALAAARLNGLPVGGWGETAAALAEIAGHLPCSAERSFTLDEFVAAAYEVVGADSRTSGRYRCRTEEPRA